jgi:hypothetical protein
MVVSTDGNVGIGTTAPTDRLHVNGTLRVATLGAAGATALCRNASGQIATCSSSLRYKTDIKDFTPGLDLLRNLRPVSFRWKDEGTPDLGFVAEEVATIDPRLATYGAKGEVEGVKYDRVGVILVNAVKEQQAEIESLRRQVDALKALVCASQPDAAVCKK